jgi:hypothetical protein
MTIDPDFDRTRRFSAAEVRRLLGVTEPTVDRLFVKARTVLGPERTDLCLNLAHQAPLTRRWVPTAAIAALIVGTAELGREWWARPHEELAPSLLWAVKGVPDNVLTSLRTDPELEDSGSSLAALAGWIADDAANKKWGRPVDRVDPADPRVDGAVGVPPGARAGDRLTAIVSPGGRVWVDVIERGGGEPASTRLGTWPGGTGRNPLGTRLAERTYHEAAQVRSAWTIATATGPLRLPGEIAGRATDPFSSPIDRDSSRRIYDWALAHGVTAQQLGVPWRTKDALWTARHRIGLPYGKPGPWVDFDDAVAAAVDGDRGALTQALAALER